MESVKEFCKRTGATPQRTNIWIQEGRLIAKKIGGSYCLLGLQDKPKAKGRGKAKRGHKRLGIVKQFSKQGELIATYETLALASEAVETTSANISIAINNPSRTAKGYKWEREDLY